MQFRSIRWRYDGDGKLPGGGDGRSSARRQWGDPGGRVLQHAHRVAISAAHVEGTHLLRKGTYGTLNLIAPPPH